MDIKTIKSILCDSRFQNSNEYFYDQLKRLMAGESVEDYRTLQYIKEDNKYSKKIELVSESLAEDIRKHYAKIITAIFEEEYNSSRKLYGRLYEDLSTLINLPNENCNDTVYFPVLPFVRDIAKEIGISLPECDERVKFIVSNQSWRKTHNRNYDLLVIKETIAWVDTYISTHQDINWMSTDKFSLLLIFNSNADLARLEEDIDQMHADWQRRKYKTKGVFEIGRYKILLLKPRIVRGTRTDIGYIGKDVFWTECINRLHSAPCLRPKLYYLACNGISENNPYYEKKEPIDVHIGDSYCAHVNMESYKPKRGETTNVWSSKNSFSDKELVKCTNYEMDYFNKGVTGPTVIVSLDTMSAFPYWEEDTPFLMDDDMVAVKLIGDNLSLSVLSSRINNKLSRIVYDLRHDNSLISSHRALTITNEDKEYLLMHSWDRLILKRDKKIKATNVYKYPQNVWDNLCKNEKLLNSYLDALYKAGFIVLENKEQGTYSTIDNAQKKTIQFAEVAFFVIEVSFMLDLYLKPADEPDYIKFGEGSVSFDFAIELGGHMLDAYFEDRLSLNRGTILRNKKHAIDLFDEHGKTLSTFRTKHERSYIKFDEDSHKRERRLLRIHRIILAVSIKNNLEAVKTIDVQTFKKEIKDDKVLCSLLG